MENISVVCGVRGGGVNPFPSQANPLRVEAYIFVNNPLFTPNRAGSLGIQH